MADPVNIHEAKTQISELVEQLGPLSADPKTMPPREPGARRGRVRMADDFDAYDAEIARTLMRYPIATMPA